MSASDWHRETLSNRACVYTSSSHAFGTDAFLLAHFAAPHKRERVCDLGTGCGIIPLIFARDDAASEVLGVELQELTVLLNEHGGVLDLDYRVEVEHALCSRNRYHIEIQTI